MKMKTFSLIAGTLVAVVVGAFLLSSYQFPPPQSATAPTPAQRRGPQMPFLGSGGGDGMSSDTGIHFISYTNAAQILAQTAQIARKNVEKNEVIFSGQNITIAMAAVEPHFPDTTFEVTGLINPTIVVPAGAHIKLILINMDYGSQMDHGVEITNVAPPYPPFSMMGAPNTFVGIRILPPRQSENIHASLYAESSTIFTTPPVGTYYYLCQYGDHAHRGMYGRFVVQAQ